MTNIGPNSMPAQRDSPQATDLCKILLASEFFTSCLREATHADLPDWWLCGGIVRETIWAHLSNTSSAAIFDVDLIYFDQENATRERDRSFELSFGTKHFGIPWSIKNQARMWRRSGDEPYKNSLQALVAAPDSISSIGVKRDKTEKLLIFAPYGLEDLFQMCLAPTEAYLKTHGIGQFRTRIKDKRWLDRWTAARITDEPRRLSHSQPFEWYDNVGSPYVRSRKS